MDLISDSENASQDSWLIDGIWYCSGSFCYVEFSDAGTHEITLISRNGNCEEIATKTIQVINLTTEIKEIDNSQFSINLNEQFIEVTSNSNEVEFDTIELFDVNGKLLGNWDSKGQDFYRINHSNFPSGVYLIRISAGTILLQMDKIVK